MRDIRPIVCNFIKKETLAQVFSYEFCKISKNTFSYRTPPVAASEGKHHKCAAFQHYHICLGYTLDILLFYYPMPPIGTKIAWPNAVIFMGDLEEKPSECYDNKPFARWW